MTPKEYLLQLLRLQIQIDQRTRQQSKLRQQLTEISGVDYSKPMVKSSVKQDAPFARSVEKLIELTAQIDEMITALEYEKNGIIGQIQAMDNTLYAQILFKRYVEFKKLEEIAVEMNYSYEHIRRAHGQALSAFDRQFLKVATQ